MFFCCQNASAYGPSGSATDISTLYKWNYWLTDLHTYNVVNRLLTFCLQLLLCCQLQASSVVALSSSVVNTSITRVLKSTIKNGGGGGALSLSICMSVCLSVCLQATINHDEPTLCCIISRLLLLLMTDSHKTDSHNDNNHQRLMLIIIKWLVCAVVERKHTDRLDDSE